MTDNEEDFENDAPEQTRLSGYTLNKVVAISFVVIIYLIVFLKILLLE